LSLPRRMLRQLAAQLGGTLRIDQTDDRATVTLDMPNPRSRTA
jgi:hypothetical protein